MQRLPTLTLGGFSWRLPLAGSVAAGLIDVLLAESDGERVARLASLLGDDPALALWSACRAGAQGAAPPDGVADLADWLAPRVLAELQWRDDERGPAESEEDAGRVASWGDLTERGVAAAREASQLAARRRGREQPDLAYLFGLLHGAADWLATCRAEADPPEDPSAPEPLPDWLAGLLDEFAAPGPAHGPAQLVRVALDRLGQGVGERAKDSGALRSQAHAAAVKTRWLDAPDRAAGPQWPVLLSRLAERLARLERLERGFAEELEREKLDALKELAYGASHEINNPLANISTRAQTLLRTETDPERRRKLATINAQAFRAHEMISDLMLFAKPPEIRPEPIELNPMIDEVIGELAEQARGQGTEIVREGTDAPMTARADPVQLPLAIKAMCVNSLEALGAGGRIEIRAAAVSGPATEHRRQWMKIVVRDTGPGISPPARRHLFDPYFSGREAGRGLGLGLSKCWRIVTEHGGRIEAHSNAKDGTTFTILLPNQ